MYLARLLVVCTLLNESTDALRNLVTNAPEDCLSLFNGSAGGRRIVKAPMQDGYCGRKDRTAFLGSVAHRNYMIELFAGKLIDMQ